MTLATASPVTRTTTLTTENYLVSHYLGPCYFERQDVDTHTAKIATTHMMKRPTPSPQYT